MKYLRYLLWIVVALVALLIIVVVIGALLPVEHQASRRALIPSSLAETYRHIAHVERYPEWRAGVHRIEHLAPVDGRARYRETGRDDSITYEVVEARENQRFVTRIADPALPFGGTWTFELTPVGDSTEVRITEAGEVYNPLFRVVSRFIIGHTSGIERYLRDLGRRVGAEVVIRE